MKKIILRSLTIAVLLMTVYKNIKALKFNSILRLLILIKSFKTLFKTQLKNPLFLEK